MTESHFVREYIDPGDGIFWYGFSQQLVHFMGGTNSFESSRLSRTLNDLWDLATDRYTDTIYDEEKLIEVSPEDVQQNQEVIENSFKRMSYDYTYYVNDVINPTTQVLMTYNHNNRIKDTYLYGNERLTDSNNKGQIIYLYDGRGSVVQMESNERIEASFIYGPYGGIETDMDDNFVGYGYNGEEYNNTIGLQYLRYRYYKPDLGSFITMDNCLGNPTDIVSQNRYTYGNNDPINNNDPSGHYANNIAASARYYQSRSLNELRDYMIAAGMHASEVQAANRFNNAVIQAANMDINAYESINTISSALANNYINKGISKAQEVACNYGCDASYVTDQAIAKLQSAISGLRNNANNQINSIKQNKKNEYEEYQSFLEQLRKQEESERVISGIYCSAGISEQNSSIDDLHLDVYKLNAGTSKKLAIWNPWQDFPQYKGYIHNAVVSYLADKYGLEKETNNQAKTMRYDLYNSITNEIWEVKPGSYSVPNTTRWKKLVRQLKDYLIDNGDLIPGHPLGNDQMTFGIYKVNIYSQVDGIIYYNFSRESLPNIPFGLPTKDTDEDTENKKDPDWGNLTGLGLILGGFACITATIIEDFVTLGAGIANGPDSIAAGWNSVQTGATQLNILINQLVNS